MGEIREYDVVKNVGGDPIENYQINVAIFSPKMTEPDEEIESNILAAGGVLMALDQGGMEAVPMTVDGVMTNKIIVQPHYLKFCYLITVERIPEEDEAHA